MQLESLTIIMLSFFVCVCVCWGAGVASPPTQSLSVWPGGPLNPRETQGQTEVVRILKPCLPRSGLDILENTEAAGS